MKKQIRILFFVLCTAQLLGSCSDNKVDCSTVTYSQTIVPILSNSCMGSSCHGAGSANGDYTAYAGIRAKVDNGSFKDRVLDKKNMPPNGLSKEDLNKMKCWFDAGAPNN